MKRLMLTIMIIVVISSKAQAQYFHRGPQRIVCHSAPRFYYNPVGVYPRVICVRGGFGGSYGSYGHGRYGLGRTSTAKGIAVAQTVFDGLSLLMEHQQIDKDRAHEIQIINAQQKQVIQQEQQQEELDRLRYEIEKARLQKELEQIKTGN